MNARNFLYDRGAFRSYRVGVPVISVGNITVGGTGKTPLVVHIAQLIADAGGRPAIVSRGYRRKNENELVVVSDGEKIIDDAKISGDEPLEMAFAMRGRAAVVCDADRVRGSVYAVEKLGATAIVLDDGFQHRRVRRELDILTIDATSAFGGKRTVPGGRLREPLSNIARADAIVITRAEQADDPAALESEIRTRNKRARIFTCRTRLDDLILFGNPDSPKEQPGKRKYFLFCGLGNPRQFERFVEAQGLEICGTEEFPDHHRYTEQDIARIQGKAESSGAVALLTTMKDAVKLSSLGLSFPCYGAKISLEIDVPSKFLDLIEEVL